MLNPRIRHGVLLALAVASPAAVASEVAAQRRPYARKAPIPEDAPNDPYLNVEINSVTNAVVPSRSEVEAPPYPGAVIIRSVPPQTLSAQGERYTTLPVLVLVTPDEPEQVIAYYEEMLSNWSGEEIRFAYYFWLGESDFDPLQMLGKTTPSVRVIPAGNIRLVPDAKTEIHVRYSPGGGYASGSFSKQ
jgi:hypothetical protein